MTAFRSPTTAPRRVGAVTLVCGNNCAEFGTGHFLFRILHLAQILSICWSSRLSGTDPPKWRGDGGIFWVANLIWNPGLEPWSPPASDSMSNQVSDLFHDKLSRPWTWHTGHSFELRGAHYDETYQDEVMTSKVGRRRCSFGWFRGRFIDTFGPRNISWQDLLKNEAVAVVCDRVVMSRCSLLCGGKQKTTKRKGKKTW